MPDYYGKGGRLTASPQRTLVESAYTHDCEDAEILLRGMHKADIAYAIMLIEEGIIPSGVGSELLGGLLELEQIPDSEFPIDPVHGDVYNNKDAELKKRIGDTAGWLHIGRPRREAVNIAYLLSVRENLLDLARSFYRLSASMLSKAEQNAATIIPDFTYLHHAQPTTFGHYLLTFLYPLLRDQLRLEQAFDNVNQSPAGSGSVNGSRLPLNRERMADLLGFSGIAIHARDAMWQVDTPIESMSVLVSSMTNLSRLVEELQIWNTAEFNMVDLPDSLCRASVIMPQKKNPYPLAYIRGVASSLLGQISNFSAYGKIASGNPDSRIFIYGELPRAIRKTSGAIDLLSVVVDDLEINSEIALERVKAGFSYSTDLAEQIVAAHEIDYRTSHHIVGAAVRNMIAQKLPGSSLDAELLDRAAEEITGQPLGMKNETIKALIRPENIVNSRQTLGGASREQLHGMFGECRDKLAEFDRWIEQHEKEIRFVSLDEALKPYLRDAE
jgi:argininosuccinate lyase